jgi:hypothetical protein
MEPVVALTPRILPMLLAGCCLTGCGSITAGDSARPTANQQRELASSLQDEVNGSLAALTVSTPATPAFFPVIANCPAVSSTTDSDADGIPNDATLTFQNPPCVASGFGGGSLAVTGTARIQDPSGANGTAFDLTLTNLSWAFSDSAGSNIYTAVRNGTRARIGSTSAARVTNDLTIQRLRPPIATATITVQTVDSFIAASPGTLQVGQPLPSGFARIVGSISWHRSTENWTLAVATTSPLQYDATCLTTPQRIVAGQLTLTGTVAGVPGVLTVTWSGCGTDPARHWTATP